jgi:hypothetical protein
VITLTREENNAAQATASAEKPKAHKKARVAAKRAHVAPKKAKKAPKAKAAKKPPKGAKKAHGARDGSKTAKILDLLKRSNGATLAQLMTASGWQPHSVRGFLSGTIRKKMGITVASTKAEDGERIYQVKP